MSIKRLIWILLVAILFAGLVRLLLLDSFRVASGAMNETLNSGDRVLVEKWTLGSRMPQALGIPFSGIRTCNLKLGSTTQRLPGLSALRRNDLIVFNQPQYSDSIPINLRPILISRCVGLPGDGVQLIGQRLYVNRSFQKRGLDAQFCFYFDATAMLSIQKSNPKQPIYTNNDTCFTFLTKHNYLRLAKKDTTFRTLVRPYISRFDTLKTFIPYKGMTIVLDSASFNKWQKVINAHEGCHLIQSKEGHYMLNGIRVIRYTFKQNYYLVLNDHQGFLNDSRTFGLVPASHIIGRSLFILFSPKEKRFMEIIKQ